MNLTDAFYLKQFLAFTILVLSHNLFAQNPGSTTVKWNSGEFTDQLSNDLVNVNTVFITHGVSEIEWIQKNGSLTYSLTIQSTEGTWTNVNADGTLLYNVTKDDLSGTITISWTQGTNRILIDLQSPTGDIKNEYIISTVEIL